MLENGDGSKLLFKALTHSNAYEETIRRLLQSIRLGLVRTGEKLPPERELATMLKVSRDTVREALASLAEQGFVVSKRGRYGGTFVVDALPTTAISNSSATEITDREVIDVVTLRRIIEIGAAREAASKNLSVSDRSLLVSVLRNTEVAQVDHYRHQDSRLHLLIAELTGSQSLIPMMADLRTRLNFALDEIPTMLVNLSNSDEQHKQIIEAILAGNPDAAARAMEDHLAGTEALLYGYFVSHSI